MPLVIAGATSGSTTVQATDAVTAVITLPSATGTVQLANSALNGSLGATTPSTVVATTITASGAVSLATTATANSVVTIGGAPSTNNSGAIKLITSSNQYNWEISQGLHTADGVFDITPSTLVGGSTFTTPVLALRASGGVQTLNTIGVGNATPSTSGAGITFPATQSASTNANTLDDYEEGTWTPVLRTETGGLMTATYTAQYGTYIKVGKQVIARGIMGWSALTRTGLVMLVNLPFLSAGANADAGYIDSSTGISFTSRTGGVGSVMQLSGYTTEYFSYQVSGSGQTFGDPRMDATAFPNVGGVSFTLIYITS